MGFSDFLYRRAVENNVTAVSNAMNALFDIAVVGASAQPNALACSSGSASPQSELAINLQGLVQHFSIANDAIAEWQSSSSLSAHGFNDEFFQDPMEQVTQLFQALLQHSPCIGLSIQYILPDLATAAYNLVEAMSPRYSCKSLAGWGLLDGLMDQLYFLDVIYSLDEELPSSLPGTCGVFRGGGYTTLSFSDGSKQTLQVNQNNSDYSGATNRVDSNRGNRVMLSFLPSLLVLI